MDRKPIIIVGGADVCSIDIIEQIHNRFDKIILADRQFHNLHILSVDDDAITLKEVVDESVNVHIVEFKSPKDMKLVRPLSLSETLTRMAEERDFKQVIVKNIDTIPEQPFYLEPRFEKGRSRRYMSIYKHNRGY